MQSFAWVIVASGMLQQPSAVPAATPDSLALAPRFQLLPPRDPLWASRAFRFWPHAGALQAGAADSAVSQRPTAVRYSDNYYRRLTVHRDVSYAMLPLFVAEYALGQSLYNQLGTADTLPTSRSLRSWHGVVADAIGVLFVVNTYTGFLNLEESSVTAKGRTRREVHSALMVLSELGFVATGQLAPGRGGASVTRRNEHRTVAILSISTAVVGDALMLIWNH